MKYRFKYKRKLSLFWKSKMVIGHSIEYYDERIYDGNNNLIQLTKHPKNAMVLYYEDGSLERIADWDNYDMKLGVDWKLAIKQQMEREINQDIKLNV